jgi:acetyltransferase-like isoleucine patch superfamily enzyme
MKELVLNKNTFLINIPYLNPNDLTVTISNWNVENGQYVEVGTELFSIETSKANYDYSSENSGYVFFFESEKSKYQVGEAIGIISSDSDLTSYEVATFKSVNTGLDQKGNLDENSLENIFVTNKAKILMNLNGLTTQDFDPSLTVVTVTDVERYLKLNVAKKNEPLTGELDLGNKVNLGIQKEGIEHVEDYKKNFVEEFISISKGENCFVGLGVSMTNVTLGDRVWINKHATIYGSEVTIGNDCYLGPYVWLEGHGGIKIGNSVHIAGPGTCLYTHSGVKIALRGGLLGNPSFNVNSMGYYHEKISIGNFVWIGPNCTLFPGVVIDDYVVVFPNTLVKKGHYKSFSLLLPDGSIEEDSDFVKNLIK